MFGGLGQILQQSTTIVVAEEIISGTGSVSICVGGLENQGTTATAASATLGAKRNC
jgi:hypothetical protein